MVGALGGSVGWAARVEVPGARVGWADEATAARSGAPGAAGVGVGVLRVVAMGEDTVEDLAVAPGVDLERGEAEAPQEVTRYPPV